MIILDFLNSISDMASLQCNNNCKREAIFRKGISFYIKYTILSFLFVFIILLIVNLCHLDFQNTMASDTVKIAVKTDLLTNMLCMCLAGPVLEEIIFRLWLSFNRFQIAISLFFISYVILTIFIFKHDNDGSLRLHQYTESVGLKSIFSITLASPIALLKDSDLNGIKKKYGRAICLFSILTFALIHATNVSCSWFLIPLAILVCLPQLVLGTTITYFRINMGFGYGLLFHCAVNTIITCISYSKEIASYMVS